MRKSFTLIELLIVVAILLLLISMVAGGCNGCIGWHGLKVSSGYRSGELQKFSDGGVVWSTWEGELALPGYKRQNVAGGSVWEFSAWDPDVIKKLQSLGGKNVKVFYRQHRWVAPWTGATAYEVYDVQPAETQSAENEG